MEDKCSLLTLEDAQGLLWMRLKERFQPTGLPPLYATADDPSADRSAMDGVALRASDGFSVRRIIGTIFAGDDPSRFFVGPLACKRVMTGAVIPRGADAVVPMEEIEVLDGSIRPLVEVQPGRHIRFKGEQARRGDRLLEAGATLSAPRRGLFAQHGNPLPPLRRIRVGVLLTGDELSNLRVASEWQIRDSNAPMLSALAHSLGADVVNLPSLKDDPRAIRDFFSGDIPQAVVCSGGVSMGERDWIPSILRDLGADILFHKIRLKPGKPMLAAVLRERVVLALPGNPVSAYLNALLFLPIVMAALEGRSCPTPWKRGRLLSSVMNRGDRPLLQPCLKLENGLMPLDSRGSADLLRLAQADVCAWIPEGGSCEGDTRYLDLI